MHVGVQCSSHEREQVVAQQTAFRQLESILAFHKFARVGRHSDALRELTRLSFLPLDSRTPERSSEALRSTAPAVQAAVPDLLKVAITCLDNVSDSDGSVRNLKSKVRPYLTSGPSFQIPSLSCGAVSDRPCFSISLSVLQIASFVANSLPRNWPHELYERVARML